MLIPISDQSRMHEELKRVRRIIGDPFDLNRRWLKDEHLQVLPVPTGGHFSGDQSSRLADAFREEGFDHLVAIAAEEMIDDPWLYELDATAADIDDFSFTCGATNFVLLPLESDSVGALCTVNDYALVFGSTVFLERFLFPNTIDQARQEFRAVYESYAESNRQSLDLGAQYLAEDR
jgi:hypothetical protein